MISGFERFVAELRRAGVTVSPAEWLDALRSVDLVGLGDRERFRGALACALVKRASQRDSFERVFDRFFSAPGWGSGGRNRRGRGAGAHRGRRSPLIDEPPSSPRRPDVLPGRSEDSDERPESLHEAVSSMRQGAPHRQGRWRKVIADRDPSKPPSPAASGSGPPGVSRTDASDPLHRDLARRFSDDEERAVAALVPRIISRIRLRTGRRLRSAPRGRLYLRRVFRDNLRHGGVPWELPYRRLRPRRSRIVLLIDVSWSAARAAGLFVSIAGEVLRRARDTRVLFFVDRAVDATSQVEAWCREQPTSHAVKDPREAKRPGTGIVRGGVSFAKLLASLPGLNLDAPSDYGRAFHALSRSGSRPGGARTALVILGDGRTNRFDAQSWAFEDIARGCGAVIWLVPEPVSRWGTGDSALASYLPYADVAVEARNLAGLARGVAELVRRL